MKKTVTKKKPETIIKPMTLEEIFGKPTKKEFFEAVKTNKSKKSLGRKLQEKLSRKANRTK
jgi:hypothetical protein